MELLERGKDDHAARLFVETIALGPGAWEGDLTPEMREVFIANAPTRSPTISHIANVSRSAAPITCRTSVPERYVELVQNFARARFSTPG